MNDIITRENLRLVLHFTSHLLAPSSVQFEWWHLIFFLVWDLTGSGYVVGQDTLLSQSLSSTRSINGYWGSVKEAWWNTWDKFVMDWHSFPSSPPPWGIVILLVTLCYRNWDGLQLERFLCFPCRVFSVFCPLWEFLPLSFSKLWQLSRTQFKSKVSVVFVIIRNCTYH